MRLAICILDSGVLLIFISLIVAITAIVITTVMTQQRREIPLTILGIVKLQHSERRRPTGDVTCMEMKIATTAAARELRQLNRIPMQLIMDKDTLLTTISSSRERRAQKGILLHQIATIRTDTTIRERLQPPNRLIITKLAETETATTKIRTPRELRLLRKVQFISKEISQIPRTITLRWVK